MAQAQLAKGGNVIGQGVPLHPHAVIQTTRQPNTLLWRLLAIFAVIAGLAINSMYAWSLFHPFNASHASSSATAYTYTAVYDPLRWVWFGLALASWLIIPLGIYFVRDYLGYVDLISNFGLTAFAGVLLVVMSCMFPPTLILKQDLASHANAWLQTTLHTTYDVTDELGSQERFTEKLDALTIDGKTVNFYLSRAGNTVLIRTVK